MGRAILAACAAVLLLWACGAFAGEQCAETPGDAERPDLWKCGACEVYPAPELLAEGRLLVLRSAGRYRGYPPPEERPDARWNLELVDLADGQRIWGQHIRGRPRDVVIEDGRAYVLNDFALHAFSTETGELLWRGGIDGTPRTWVMGTAVGSVGAHPGAFADDRPRRSLCAAEDALLLRIDDTIWCVDPLTGRARWNRPLGIEGEAQVGIADGIVYVAPVVADLDGSAASAIELKTGRVLWRSDLPAGRYAYHVLGEAVYVTGSERHTEVTYEKRVVGVRISGSGLNVTGGSASVQGDSTSVPVSSESMRWGNEVIIEGRGLAVTPRSLPGRMEILGYPTIVRGGSTTVETPQSGRSVRSEDLSWGGGMSIRGTNLTIKEDTITIPNTSVTWTPVVLRLSERTGEVSWRSEFDRPLETDRAWEADGTLVLAGPTGAVAVNAETGEPEHGAAGWCGDVICRGDELLYAGGAGRLKAYDTGNLDGVWSVRVPEDGPTDLVLVDDTLVAQMPNWAAAYDAPSGELLWERNDPVALWSVAGTGLVGAVADAGVAVDVRSGTELTRVPTEPSPRGWIEVLPEIVVHHDWTTGWLRAQAR